MCTTALVVPQLWVVALVFPLNSHAHDTEPRWYRHVLNETDHALQRLLSERVDTERVTLSLQFLLAYKELLERLIRAARLRDPRVIEVLRDLENIGGRPRFVKVLPDLSLYQEALNWTTEDLNIVREQLLEIYNLINEFKRAVHDLIEN